MQLQNGTLLQGGKYKIEKVLGQGGFGITYLATQTLTDKKVAIKEFFFKEYCERDNVSGTVTVPTTSKKKFVEKFQKKFLKEAKIISDLNHKNIIRVLDVFQENDTSYYSMEYIIGKSLAQEINAKGKIDETEAISIIDSIGQALSYLHERHINHLDVKPGNIMIDEKEHRTVLIDFGVSKQYDPETGDGTTTTPVGISHGYSPLEQYNTGGVNNFSPQSDIYALGATLLKMISGQTPPSAIDISQHGLPQLPSTISPWIDKAIRTAMQPIKESRPASVQQFITIIHERKAAPEETIFSGTVEKEKDKKRSSIVGKTLLIALLVAAVIGVIYVMNQSSAVNMPDVVTEDNMPIPYEEPLNEAPSNNDLKTKRYSKEVDSSTGTNKLNIDYPTSGNAILLQNIREWINEELGGTYDGDLNDGATFFAYYTKGLDNNEEDGYSTTDIKKANETSKIITYIKDCYAYAGGAHGYGFAVGVTFRKIDGKKFSKDMIMRPYAIQNDIKAGLKKYFGVVTDDELMDNLQLNNELYNINNLPLPETDPWITKDGVFFSYAPYEIASYAAGAPSFVIPISKVKNHVTSTAKTFFDE